MTSFYGQGFNYPVSLNTSHGILMSSDLTNIEQSIYIILGTQFGERVMRPTFGCNLKSLVFAPNNAQTAALAKQYVTDGLQAWEPRITVQSVTVTNVPNAANSQLSIAIQYVVKGSLAPQAMIYPFYLEQS
ncbi:MAG TPA: GPW/gp25 family protein [Verrucomicrobiae bacterium]|nr:GPW/gp25 family protein [Verrucomicrobiae bacterium]HTZ56042.1 GPW/gp25 family protein [Candidatus Acidoferrum sp.]